MINRIEYLVTKIVNDFLIQDNYSDSNIEFNYVNEWKNYNSYDYERIMKIIAIPYLSGKIYYWSTYGRKRFALFLYILAEVHDLFLSRSYCTYRQLYYRNVDTGINTMDIHKSVSDVCIMLGTTSWNLGIFAAGKCFVTGPLLIHMSNGDVIDCNAFKGPTLMPPNFTYIERFETKAEFLLIIEKDTVFQNLISNDLFSTLNGKVIIVTARGYPDFCTRWILNKLSVENNIDFYVLVDGDPYGIEIMLIYRYGCVAPSFPSYNLNCPQLKWLGLHPSDFIQMIVPKEPMVKNDYNKINSLLSRQYVKDEIRTELLILSGLKYKVKIDNMSVYMFSKFINDYIVNKIKRKIVL